jgi:hypothetical protein
MRAPRIVAFAACMTATLDVPDVFGADDLPDTRDVSGGPAFADAAWARCSPPSTFGSMFGRRSGRCLPRRHPVAGMPPPTTIPPTDLPTRGWRRMGSGRTTSRRIHLISIRRIPRRRSASGGASKGEHARYRSWTA